MQVEKGVLLFSPPENTNSVVLDDSKLSALSATVKSLLVNSSREILDQTSTSLLVSQLETQHVELVLLPLVATVEATIKPILKAENRPAVVVFGSCEQAALAASCIQLGADECFLMDESALDLSGKGESSLLEALIARAISRNKEVIRTNTQLEVLSAELDHVMEDQHAAFKVQKSLLPPPTCFGDISFSYQILPRRGMSGDCVNCFELSDGRLLFYLSDVAGHGVLGGVIATALTLTAKNLTTSDFDPSGLSSSELLQWFNRAMLELALERHVTMFLGVVSADGKSLQYSSAAHFPSTILCQNDHCQYLELGGLPLGVCETNYEARTVELAAGFELILFSDGVLEILPQDSLENREKHLLSLVESGARNVSGLSVDLGLVGRAKIPDDIAVLTLQRMK